MTRVLSVKCTFLGKTEELFMSASEAFKFCSLEMFLLTSEERVESPKGINVTHICLEIDF